MGPSRKHAQRKALSTQTLASSHLCLCACEHVNMLAGIATRTKTGNAPQSTPFQSKKVIQDRNLYLRKLCHLAGNWQDVHACRSSITVLRSECLCIPARSEAVPVFSGECSWKQFSDCEVNRKSFGSVKELGVLWEELRLWEVCGINQHPWVFP